MLQTQNGVRILVDCGMFQGREERRNEEPFAFDPSSIDVVLLTHAHLDHVGRLPKLVKEGFAGTIVATRPTFELANIVLLDAAHLMEEEYRVEYRKAQRRGEESRVKKPLYTTEDVESVWLLPTVHADFGKKLKIGKGVSVVFMPAGHILGAAFVEIHHKENGKARSTVFSGDLGDREEIVLPYLSDGREADSLVIESTYGDRNHKPMDLSIDEFKKVIRNTLLNRGNVIIPSFAIERTQDILCLLKEMYLNRELPRCKVFLDSPMAIRATAVFSAYAEKLGPKCREFYRRDGDLFYFPDLHFTVDTEESRRINTIEKGAVIIAGSGMCTGGRILHHLKHNIWNRRNSVVFVGYQAAGTLGREIVDGAKWIRIYHEKIRVKATIHTINGFSAHADQKGLTRWMKSFSRLGKVFLVHGERDKMDRFKEHIRKEIKIDPSICKEGRKYDLYPPDKKESKRGSKTKIRKNAKRSAK